MGGLFSTPWRDLPQNQDEILRFVKSYKPQNVRNLRILLVGPIGAGKSSFINSIESVVQGRVCGRASTDTNSGSSFTKKFKTYKICKDQQNYCSFVINDTMGLESETKEGHVGVHVEDLILALKGHVAEGYEFTSDHPLTERDISYNSCPSLADKVHVLVFIVPATTVSQLPQDVMKKMKEVRLAARDMDIPQLAVFTKVDEANPNVKQNMNHTYKSKSLKEKVDLFHQSLGIPVNCLFLMKNYGSEMETKDDMNVHILLALKKIITIGDDLLNNQKHIFRLHLTKPWRDLTQNRDEILDFVQSYKPQKVNDLRILLVGPVDAGKSSFINSVDSVVQGRVCCRALADGTSGSSFTKKFKTYKICKDQQNCCYFGFNDTMGLESGTKEGHVGVHVEDLILALKGHVAEGYEFIPDRQLTENNISYNSSPTLADKVHVVVFVVPAGSVSQLSDDVVEKMRDVRLAARDMEIPQIVILTKVDEACPELNESLNYVYKTTLLKEKADNIHQLLGIQENCIFLVKNYRSESEMDDSMNACILLAMKHILQCGEDFINNYQSPNSAMNVSDD